MAYNPGITNRSGEILAQGIASAAQTRMQGYQNATNSLLKGFSDLTKKQQEDELQIRDANARLSSDPELENKIRASGNTKLIAQLDKFQTPVTGTMAKLFGSGKGSDAKDLIEYSKGLDTAEAKAASREARQFRVDDENRKKIESDRTGSEYENLLAFREGVKEKNATGAENLSRYNTFTTDQENKRRNEQVALGNQFISGARNDLGGTPLVSGIGGKAYAPPPVKQFDTQMGNMPPPPVEQFYTPMGMPPSQIAMPRSVPRLNQPQSPLGYQTPEQISQMVYDYTPDSNSAQQRIRAYGNMLTPQLMQGENTIEASRDRATALDARARATAKNIEQRRMEGAIRNRQLDANAAEQLAFSRSRDMRDARAEERAIASANTPPLEKVISGNLGKEAKARQDAMDKEVRASPQALEVIRQLNAQNFVVSKNDRAGMEKYIARLNLSQEAKDAILGRLRE